MRRVFALVALVVALSLTANAQITVPNNLVPGNVIRAGELNTNFNTLGTNALNRITGGVVEGNITLLTNVTIDGVDISDFLLVTGEVKAQALGTVDSAAFGAAVDPDTGLYFPAVDQVALALGGVQRLLLDTSGLTVFGVNIINADGKIPALTSTYVASLDGAALTNLNATSLASGTVADARLTSNIPRLNAATNTFSGNLSAVNGTFSGTLGVTGTSTLGAVNAGATAVSAIRVGTTATAGQVLVTDAFGNGTWQVSGTAGTPVPTGAIMLFDTACPPTWTRFAALDNKFIRGGATYNPTGGGSDTHNHTVDPANVVSDSQGSHGHTTTTAGDHQHYTDVGATGTSAAGSHAHDIANLSINGNGGHSHGGTTDNAGSHDHTRSITDSGATTGGDFGALTNVTINSDGSHNHGFSTSAVGDHGHTGGGWTDNEADHSHNVDPASALSTVQGGHAHTTDAQGVHGHNVDVGNTATTMGANVPAYVQIIFCKKD